MICNYANCLEEVSSNGLTITLKTPTVDNEKRAVFCCAAHAVASLTRLQKDRGEAMAEIPRWWYSR